MKGKVSHFVAICLSLGVCVSPAAAFSAKKPSQIIQATSSGVACVNVFGGILVDTAIMPDGSSAPLVIPDKNVLIVTAATAVATVGGNPDETRTLQLAHDVVGAITQRVGSGFSDPLGSASAVSTTDAPNFVVRTGSDLCCVMGGAFVSQCGISGFMTKDK